MKRTGLVFVCMILLSFLLAGAYQFEMISFSFLKQELGSQSSIVKAWSLLSYTAGLLSLLSLLFWRYSPARYMLIGLFFLIAILQLPPIALWLLFSMLESQLGLVIPALYHILMFVLVVWSVNRNIQMYPSKQM